MSGRRKKGAGQSGSFAGVGARKGANCSGKPGAPPAGRAPGMRGALFVFDAAAQTKAAEPEDVKLTMSRNVVTVVRFVYQEGTPGDGFAIYVLVNDNWEQIHSMEID